MEASSYPQHTTNDDISLQKPPHRRQLRRLFPVCITALSAVYCSIAVCLYNCQEPNSTDREKTSHLWLKNITEEGHKNSWDNSNSKICRTLCGAFQTEFGAVNGCALIWRESSLDQAGRITADILNSQLGKYKKIKIVFVLRKIFFLFYTMFHDLWHNAN